MMQPLMFASWNDWILAVALVGLAVALLVLGMHSQEATTSQSRRVAADAASTDAPLQQLTNPLPRWWMGLFIAIVGAALLFVLSHPRAAWRERAAPAAAVAMQGQSPQTAGATAQRPGR